MRNTKLKFAGALVAVLALVATLAYAAPQTAANFAGTWTVDMQGGGGGRGPGGDGNNSGGGNGGNNPDNGNGGNGGGGGRRGMGPQTLVIVQDGSNYKVTHETPRGDNTNPATVTGNTITWTEEREGRDGNKMTITWKGTLDGDTITGTVGGGQFTRNFTAKRGAASTGGSGS
jgi:hypothetical protein